MIDTNITEKVGGQIRMNDIKIDRKKLYETYYKLQPLLLLLAGVVLMGQTIGLEGITRYETNVVILLLIILTAVLRTRRDETEKT